MKQLKYTIRKATISDKIYFHKDDIVDVSLDTLKYVLFSYNVGTDIHYTIDYDEKTGICSVPSGSWYKLNILELNDERYISEPYNWEFYGSLKPNQAEIFDKLMQSGKLYGGLVQAPCGWGKTFLGAALIGNSKKSSLIVCHTKLLANQWYGELTKLIPNQEIGFIGDGKDVMKPITVGIYHSLLKRLHKLQDKFEVIYVDECHLAPADTFSKVINGINARTKIALTATPWRKDGLHTVLPDYFGPNKLIAKDEKRLIPSVEIVKTDIPFVIINPSRDWTKQLTKLSGNTSYLNLIAEKAITKIAHGRCILIVSERIEMLEQLQQRIPRSVLLVGKTKDRDGILERAGKDIDVILSTRIFDEGISCHRLDTLFLTCPSNNNAKLEQRIGRIQRDHPDKKSPLIVDFWLTGAIVQGQQKNRSQWYIQKNYPTLN